MSSREVDFVVCCNGAAVPRWATAHQRLDYRTAAKEQNVRVGLPAFVEGVYHIPARTLDLLEIAAYLFASDRLEPRGRKDNVEYHAWARKWLFRIRVRDKDFWSRPEVTDGLEAALKFMTGDDEYRFEFVGGHSTPPTSLFDMEGFSVESGGRPVRVALFSGGLDSLAGAVRALKDSDDHLVLVSHESQTGTMRTQRQLVTALEARFGRGRSSHYAFRCQLKGERAREETQRTRSLLYCSIGFAIARAFSCDSLDVHENGVTSINLYRRQDLMNARASRTTHPRTMKLLERLFSIVAEEDFAIRLPFIWDTKRAVVSTLADAGHEDLIASSVSCSRTFQRAGNATHCGHCFQCVDRRIAVHGAGLHESDDRGLYSRDIFRDPIDDREARTTAVDYVRQASRLARSNVDQFGEDYLVELGEVVDSIGSPGGELEKLELVWNLFRRHAADVHNGLAVARALYDDLFSDRHEGSLLDLVATREHLKDEVERCVGTIVALMVEPLQEILAGNRPAGERQLNQLVGGLLRSHDPTIRSEHPAVRFAAANVVPDHDVPDTDLLIEAKYIRGKTSPSKASEGMAADLTKYPQTSHILFLVYDPDRAISADREFVRDFEATGRCSVILVR